MGKICKSAAILAALSLSVFGSSAFADVITVQVGGVSYDLPAVTTQVGNPSDPAADPFNNYWQVTTNPSTVNVGAAQVSITEDVNNDPFLGLSANVDNSSNPNALTFTITKNLIDPAGSGLIAPTTYIATAGVSLTDENG